MAPDAEPPELRGDRYRIDSRLGSGTHMESWRGHDLRLNRSVTIRVMRNDLIDHDDTDLRALVIAHIRKAVRVEDPGLTRIYDTLGPDQVGIVSEPITGDSLGVRIEEHGPMSLDRAVSIITELAKTLDTIHEQRVVHGCLDATSIGFTSDGRLVISDLGTCGHPESTDESIVADIKALAALLHHLACGRRPHDRGRRHELDPSTPAPIAGVLTMAFSERPPWRSAQQFASALGTESETTSETHENFVRSERRWLVPVGAVLLVAVILGLIGSVVSRTSVARDIIDNARGVVGLNADPATTTTTSSTTTSTSTTVDVLISVTTVSPAPLEILRITDFDPGGDDASEHPERLTLINDSDPTRGWQTQIYASRDFGRLKDGVGLIVELVDPSTITELVVRSPTRGWSFDLYFADTPPVGIVDWGGPIHSATNITSDTVIGFNSVAATSMLIWITDLGNGPQFRTTITDIEISGTS